jgi:hypothetical protein
MGGGFGHPMPQYVVAGQPLLPAWGGQPPLLFFNINNNFLLFCSYF